MFKRLIVAVAILVAFGAVTVTDSSAQSAGGLRKFYLSRQAVDGAHTFHVCVPGFHFASLWEILNPTTLSYDVEDGATQPDAGSGPPSNLRGWIRNGSFSSGSATNGNCQVWTSNSEGDTGTIVNLPEPAFWNNAAVAVSPWQPATTICEGSNPVWCVENEP